MNQQKPYYIIGTAGHIDHGKTSLIKALTGFDTDRLKEEKERGITIDLGFAYFEGADGRRYGIIDVPGHEKFIPNMLAGAHGIDVVVMVVAADDGVKPQTIEHFDILHLLKVPRAIFVITKIDLVEPERIDEVSEEIEILTSESYLAGSKIIPASSITGEGLQDVRNEISRLVGEIIPKTDHPYFRFPIDRSFTITGFGTVVTGTITGGKVGVDDEVVLIPEGRRLRVRNIEVHEEKATIAFHGQRAAINLTKIEKTEIERGMELASPEISTNMYNRFYASFETLSHKYCNLRNFSRVRLFKGSTETRAVIVNVANEPFRPKKLYATIISLGTSLLLTSGERFIIRDETNRYTIGGGEFILPATIRRTKLTPELVVKLKGFSSEDYAGQIRSALLFDNRIFIPIDYISVLFNRNPGEILKPEKAKSNDFLLFNGKEKSIVLNSKLEQKKDAILGKVSEYHRQNPELPGIEKKTLKVELHDEIPVDRDFDRILEILYTKKTIVDIGEFIRHKDFKIEFKGEDFETKNKIIEVYSNMSGNTPKRERLPEIINIAEDRISRIFQGLFKSGEIIGLGDEMYVSKKIFDEMERKVIDFIIKNGEITVAQFRDLAQTNRNMAVLILEAMDARGITSRKENARVLKKAR